ncbi:MAG TPA: metallophosphoesterase family protein [Chthonomonadaceae bacterium]|nr:metallophosphoesterase family protein [Chthonomonadaceae bacterium]
MRLAILADIHGNLPAFEAALEHVAAQRVDRIVIVGDIVVGAPDSGSCWRLAQSLGCPILRGNHERYLFHFDTPHAPPLWKTERFGPVRWALTQCTEAERQCMADLPPFLQLPEAEGVFFAHASARSDNDTIVAYTPDSEIAAMFPDVTEPYIVRGHNHIAQVRLWEGRMIVTTGSVGLPLDGIATAQYLLLERHREGWKVQHQSVSYDVDATVRRFSETGYLEAGGPLARLFLREVATAGSQIVPFFRAYDRWQAETSLTLSEAVERFLSVF